MWTNNPLWTNNGKPEKPSKPSRMWHRRALMIDTRKTLLVLESAYVKPECTPPLIHSELVKTEEEGFDAKFGGC